MSASGTFEITVAPNTHQQRCQLIEDIAGWIADWSVSPSDKQIEFMQDGSVKIHRGRLGSTGDAAELAAKRPEWKIKLNWSGHSGLGSMWWHKGRHIKLLIPTHSPAARTAMPVSDGPNNPMEVEPYILDYLIQDGTFLVATRGAYSVIVGTVRDDSSIGFAVGDLDKLDLGDEVKRLIRLECNEREIPVVVLNESGYFVCLGIAEVS